MNREKIERALQHWCWQHGHRVGRVDDVMTSSEVKVWRVTKQQAGQPYRVIEIGVSESALWPMSDSYHRIEPVTTDDVEQLLQEVVGR